MRYIAITSPDINNGLGCRVTLWVAGCTRHCPNCQNPETWGYLQGKCLDEAYKEVFEKLSLPYIKGLSISGGDPLDQTSESIADLKTFLERVKYDFPNKDIWIYSGDVFENLIKGDSLSVLKLCDVLVDGPYIHSQRDITLPFRGSTNQRIIDLKKTFDGNGKVVIKEV